MVQVGRGGHGGGSGADSEPSCRNMMEIGITERNEHRCCECEGVGHAPRAKETAHTARSAHVIYHTLTSSTFWYAMRASLRTPGEEERSR